MLRRHNSGILVGFLVTVMTFWKTVIYGLLYTLLCTNSHPFQHASWRTFYDGVSYTIWSVDCHSFYGNDVLGSTNIKHNEKDKLTLNSASLE